MIEYKLICGTKADVEKQVTAMLNSDWQALDLTSTTIGSVINYTQAMSRTLETSFIVEPYTTETKLKRARK